MARLVGDKRAVNEVDGNIGMTPEEHLESRSTLQSPRYILYISDLLVSSQHLPRCDMSSPPRDLSVAWSQTATTNTLAFQRYWPATATQTLVKQTFLLRTTS